MYKPTHMCLLVKSHSCFDRTCTYVAKRAWHRIRIRISTYTHLDDLTYCQVEPQQKHKVCYRYISILHNLRVWVH